ncbi:MAG: branched-chain amino acid ABC transporter permease [Pseudomonadota bacterium]
MLADLLQNTFDGLAAGASYALVALGFTLIFGVLRRANLSYGPAIMLGCYAAAAVSAQRPGLGLAVLALIAIVVSVLAGAYVERLCFAPHRRGSGIAAMAASFALWMQLEELAVLLLPRHVVAFPALYGDDPIAFAGLAIRVESLVALGTAGAVCALLAWVLYRTRFGISVRAVIASPLAAEIAGIRTGRIFFLVFALASAIGGLAGFLVAATDAQLTPMMGMWFTLKGLVAMMLGGLGSLPGAVLGALALGLVEAHSQWFLGPQLRDFVVYLLLFCLLAAAPKWMRTHSAS